MSIYKTVSKYTIKMFIKILSLGSTLINFYHRNLDQHWRQPQ